MWRLVGAGTGRINVDDGDYTILGIFSGPLSATQLLICSNLFWGGGGAFGCLEEV